MKSKSAERAREYEAELELYPDERGEILLDAADSWREAGDYDRAIELLTEAILLGGEDGGCARVALAEVYFDLDRDEEAQAQLDALRHDRPPSPAPFHLAAELLEERADLQQALTMFTMAVARLTDEEMASRDDSGIFSYADNIIVGRRQVREALGLPPDELDESVSDGFAADPGLLLDHDTTLPPIGQILFWPRDEIPRAHELWPRLVQHVDTDAIFREREAVNRDLSGGGITGITMVPLTTARLVEFAARTGRDPEDQRTRLACMKEIVAEGNVIAWPPARNAPCWCGSGTKYKKCCGRPA